MADNRSNFQHMQKKVRQYLAPTIFCSLSERDHDALAETAEFRSFQETEGSIWGAPKMADKVLVVGSGRFRVMRRLEGRKTQVLLHFARVGSLLGVSHLVGQPRTTDVVASDRGGALVLSARLLREQIARMPTVAFALLRQENSLASAFVDEIASLRSDSFAHRLLDRIERLVDEERPYGNQITIKIDQADLAAMVGGGASEVSRHLKKLVPGGVLRWKAGVLAIADIANFRDIVRATWGSPRTPT
jgi:CRP-like cAMP-binding protein